MSTDRQSAGEQASPHTLSLTRCAPRPPVERGVVHHEPERCQPGLTLCWSGRSARLVDLSGRDVHRWSLEEGPPWHEAQLLDNGHLLVVANDSPYSPRQVAWHWLIELDRDGQIVWESHARVHHDAQRLPNGNTLVVASAPAQYLQIHDRELIYDYLQELTPDGKVAWSWHYAPHESELDLPASAGLSSHHGDWPHINTIQSLPDTPAGRHDARFRAGNLLVSPRHLHLIFIIDRDTGGIVWQWGAGEILGQHQPTMLDTGNILLFDNGMGSSSDAGEMQMRGWSRALELDPLSGDIVWEYHADPPTDFWTPVGSGAQRLPNGNTLICAMNYSEPGRIFEVTPAGRIVWDYWSPEGTSFYRAYRFSPGSAALAALGV
ncbi:MAG: aryl-sulfate sulfotransferase [bacterium]